MPRPPSVQWYYKQYLGDNKVLAMDWDARGMHVHLLMLSIQEEPPGTIPADDAAIRRWLSLPLGSVDSDQTWRRVKSQLLAAWQPEGDRLVNHGMQTACVRQRKYRDRYEIGTKNAPDLKADEVKQELVVDFDVGSKPPNSDEVVDRIVKAHPYNWRAKGAIQVSQAQSVAVMDAIKRDSVEKVEQGTNAYAEAVGRWPPEERKFVMNPVKFFGREAHYLQDPSIWERAHAPSKNKQRINDNREAILIGLGLAAEHGSSESDLQDRHAARGNPRLAALTSGDKS